MERSSNIDNESDSDGDSGEQAESLHRLLPVDSMAKRSGKRKLALEYLKKLRDSIGGL